MVGQQAPTKQLEALSRVTPTVGRQSHVPQRPDRLATSKTSPQLPARQSLLYREMVTITRGNVFIERVNIRDLKQWVTSHQDLGK